MSTLVSDLIEEVQDRIPEDKLANLFPALNRAISVISDRLYILESGLIIDELEILVYASIDYTAATIAFVDNSIEGVDTITDSANQFVVEGFKAGMAIETTCSGNEGPFRITTAAAGTLTLHAEDAVAVQAVGTSYKITSSADYGYLPDAFGGFVEKPYIDGYTWELDPLPSQREKLVYSSAGTPHYYKIKGNRVYVIPATSTDITIKGDYYQKKTKITKMNQYVPFYETLDSAIQEYLVAVLGGDASQAEAALLASVELVALKRDKRAATGMPGGISWGF